MDYMSPVLENLQPADTIINMPPELVACRHCPASIWMLDGQELRCYCQALHVVIWSDEQRAAPTRCDAQIAALAQMQQAPKSRPKSRPSSEHQAQPLQLLE